MKDARRRRLPTLTFRGTMCSKELGLTPRQVSVVAIQVVSKYHQRLILSRSGAWVLTLPLLMQNSEDLQIFVTFAGNTPPNVAEVTGNLWTSYSEIGGLPK